MADEENLARGKLRQNDGEAAPRKEDSVRVFTYFPYLSPFAGPIQEGVTIGRGDSNDSLREHTLR